MRQWKDDIDDVTALYPSFAAWESKPYGHYIGTVTDTATVPATPYKMVLDFRPVRGKLGITLNAAAAALIEWGQTPTTGQVAVDYIGGNVEFAAADTAKTAVATYAEHYGSVLSAADWMQVQKDLVAAQGAANGPLQIVSVGKQNADYTTIQAAVDAVDALGDCGAAKPYAIAVYPGVYAEAVVVDVAYLTLVGVGGPEACVIRNDDDISGSFVGAVLRIEADHVRVENLGIRNLFTVTPASEEATPGITVGVWAGNSGFTDVSVRNCIVTVNGRDALFVRGAAVRVEDSRIAGFSHSPSVDYSASLTMVGCSITTTYAPCYIGSGTGHADVLNLYDCRVTSSSAEAMLFLTGDGAGVATIAVGLQNVRCSAGMYLYQTPAGHGGRISIVNHSGVVVDGDRTGALVGSVTLTAREERAFKAASLTATEGDITGSLGIRGSRLYLTDESTAATATLVADDGIAGMSAYNAAVNALVPFKASQLQSSIATGTAPLTVASTTKVSNLNADLLDDLSSAAFVQHTIADAKGDIIAATGADALARVAAGADGKSPVYDSSAAAGIAAAWRHAVISQTLATGTELNGSGSTEQFFDQNYQFAANQLEEGSVWQVDVDGVASGNGTSETATLKLYFGSTIVINSSARSTQNTSVGNCRLQAFFVVRSTGATGSVLAEAGGGNYWIYYTTGGGQVPALMTVDTTATQLVRASIQWSGTNANNKAKLLSFRLTRLA